MKRLFSFGIFLFLGSIIPFFLIYSLLTIICPFLKENISWFDYTDEFLMLWSLGISLFIVSFFIKEFWRKRDLEEKTFVWGHEKANFLRIIEEINSELKEVKKNGTIWKNSLMERSKGFPSLLKAIAQYEILQDKKNQDFLLKKSHPAKKAAALVKEEQKKRRIAEYELRRIKGIQEYYETIAPFLMDLKDESPIGCDEEEYIKLGDYTEEEKEDIVTQYLTKEEYRKLSSVEKNQLALDRYWTRHKSKHLIGKIYERYVGYLWEKKGYQVEYEGIFKGFEDLGRDLICTKENEAILIQCKNWSQFKTIYEKHIFQFFGTLWEFKTKNSSKNVSGIFYTSTSLSDVARGFAKDLKIELIENFHLDLNYPVIKCHISRAGGSKIYHLPFDQQYDRTKINNDKGDFYCKTVQEAELKGFRRAFRYKGLHSKK